MPEIRSPTKTNKRLQASPVSFVKNHTHSFTCADQEIDLDSTSIELKGAEISSIDFKQGCLRMHIARASLIKTLTGSNERTRWWQAGILRMDDAVLSSPLPLGPLVCTGGDLDENIYTYRGMIPIPLASRGHIRCELHFEGEASPFVVTASTVELEMQGTPKYLEHLRT